MYTKKGVSLHYQSNSAKILKLNVMQMTRTVYHIAGNDYNTNDSVTITFNVLAVSIQNFLLLVKESRCYVASFGQIFTDNQQTTTNGDMKTFKIKGAARNMVELAKKLGKKDFDNFNDNWNIRNSALRAKDFTRCTNTRFNGLSVFDPVTKITTFKSNSPVKMIGRQQVIGGKLWRKYYTSEMR